jgi:hypothetical protein
VVIHDAVMQHGGAGKHHEAEHHGASGKVHGDHGKAAHEPCPFGLLAVGGLPATDIALAAPEIAPSSTPAALPPLPARAPPTVKLPPSTGPPSFA